MKILALYKLHLHFLARVLMPLQTSHPVCTSCFINTSSSPLSLNRFVSLTPKGNTHIVMAILELAGLSLEALQATIVTAVIIAFCVSFLQLSHRAKLAKLPVIGEKSEKWRKHYLDTGRSIYVDGYKRVCFTRLFY